MYAKTIAFRCLCLWLAFVGAGCTGRGPLGAVHGRVSYKGIPLARGIIVFEVTGARPASAQIVNGQITEVTTFRPNDGVPVGHAAVAVFAFEPPAPSAATSKPGEPNYMGMDAKSLVPQKYNHPQTSGLNCVIHSGENEVVFDLQE
jgi:hypothetical protein